MVGYKYRFLSCFVLAVALIQVVTISPALRGDLIIATDTNALAGWYGMLPTNGVTPQGTPKYLNVDIQYAVYLPGTFNSSFPDKDPSGGTKYVYAYQLHNLSSSTDTGIKEFTVGLLAEAFPIDYVTERDNTAVPSTKVSSPGLVGTTSVKWSYSPVSNRVAPNSYSKLLIFTSPYGPHEDFANLVGYSGATTPSNIYMLPSPVPEPATLLVLGITGALFLLFRKL